MIKIKKLNKFFNKNRENQIHVLKDLNFEVNLNEYVSIMGTSGVGKSTLLNIIGGLDTFDSGEYIFNGIDMSNISEKKLYEIIGKQITYVFQDYSLIEEDSIIDNVKVPLYFDKKFKGQNFNELAKKALRQVGIPENMYNKKCALLSGGQKQRVAIARSIVNSPKILLADEPTGSLDEKSTEEILELFESLVSENLSIILVTHDRKVAERTQKIYQMVDGHF